jgi:hypothetical protein
VPSRQPGEPLQRETTIPRNEPCAPGAEPWQTALDAANAAPRCGARCRSGLPCRGRQWPQGGAGCTAAPARGRKPPPAWNSRARRAGGMGDAPQSRAQWRGNAARHGRSSLRCAGCWAVIDMAPRHMRPSCVRVGRRTSRTLRTRSSHLYIFGTAKFPRVQIGSPKRPPCPNVCAIVNGIAFVPQTFATRQTAVGDFPLRRASLMPLAILPSKRLSQLPNL